MILRVISIIAAIAVAVAPAGAQKKGKVLKTEAQNYINKISKESVLKGSHIGVLAVKVNGDTVAAINPFKRLMPASNNKLISTGLAINELGPDFRFQTKSPIAVSYATVCFTETFTSLAAATLPSARKTPSPPTPTPCSASGGACC